MNKQSILLVEDDDQIRQIMKDYFVASDFHVHEASDGKIALDIFEDTDIDIVILDIMLPELDGWSVCRRIRANSDVPIIMLTARSDDEDQLMGFELGADEYVTKPFSYKVLVARTKALLSRAYKNNGQSLSIGGIDIDESSHSLRVDDVEIEVTPKEFDLLLYLMKNNNIVLNREQILDSVWGYDYIGDGRAADTYVKKLRQKLGDKGSYIKTITRVGYKFEVKDENQ